MPLKLKDSVTAVSTADGMICRLENTFLSVRGIGVLRWFERIRPLLDGSMSFEDLRITCGPDRWPGVELLLGSLKSANMVYDVETHETSSPIPEIGKRHKEFLARLEIVSDRSGRILFELARTQLLLVGARRIIASLIDGAREVGIVNVSVNVTDQSATLKGRENTQDECGPSNVGTDVDELSRPGFSAPFDAVIIGGDLQFDWDPIQHRIRSAGDQRAWGFLLVAGDYVCTGVLTGGYRGCFRCLREIYSTDAAGRMTKSEHRETAGIQIGVRLLFEELVNFQLGALPSLAPKFFEVDLSTFRISKRPVPHSYRCPMCDKRPLSLLSEKEPPNAPSSDLSIERVVEKMMADLVDERTGFIARISELDLPQCLFHQSAALWYPPSRIGRAVWRTEAGRDVMTARHKVICRVLEDYAVITRLPRSLFRLTVPSGVVASGMNISEIVQNGLWCAMARYAHGRSGWRAISISSSAMLPGARLAWEHLNDLRMANAVRVQQWENAKSHDVEIFRLWYEKSCVCVVSGPRGADILQTGLREIWLRATALRHLSLEDYFLTTNYRCAEADENLMSALFTRFCRDRHLCAGTVLMSSISIDARRNILFGYSFLRERTAAPPVCLFPDLVVYPDKVSQSPTYPR